VKQFGLPFPRLLNEDGQPLDELDQFLVQEATLMRYLKLEAEAEEKARKTAEAHSKVADELEQATGQRPRAPGG
jgi:hypothetical protein